MKRIPILFAGSFLLATWAAAQSVVYDNTKTYLHHGMHLLLTQRKDSAEMGDEVHLSGTAREVTMLKVRFWYDGTSPGTFDGRVRLRSLRPDVLTPGPAIMDKGKIIGYSRTASPGPALYESDLLRDVPVVPGMNEYTFAIPHVKVPDRVVWTIQAYNSKGTVGNLGPAYYDPPTVGTSEDYFWQSERGSAWIAYSWGGDPVANFGCTIFAVDSPQRRGPLIPPLP